MVERGDLIRGALEMLILRTLTSVPHHGYSIAEQIECTSGRIPEFGGMAIESKYIDGRSRGEAQTLAASRWRGVIATRTQIDVAEDLAAVPAALLAFPLDV